MARAGWIAYVGPFLFPWGQPSSRRVYGIARSLADSGYRVVVGSGGQLPVEETCLEDGVDGGSITYLGLRELPNASSSLSTKAWQLAVFSGANTVAWLNSMVAKPSHVIVYGGGAPFMFRVGRWCRENGVKIIADVVEWYAPNQFYGGRFGPLYLSASIARRHFLPSCDGVIAISTFLERHYLESGCRVIRVPPTVDTKQYHDSLGRESRDSDRLLNLVYAGTPGKKDLLGSIVQGLARVDRKGERLRLLVLGPTKEQLRELLGASELFPFIEPFGRIPQNDVAKRLAKADFSILLRESTRVTEAGFPTKFVESMANGTPVIANLTSDLGTYFSDGVEGLVCGDHTPEALSEAVGRALALSPQQLREMRIAAYRQATFSFDYRLYNAAMLEFLDACLG